MAEQFAAFVVSPRSWELLLALLAVWVLRMVARRS
jgi:hypothetical protein